MIRRTETTRMVGACLMLVAGSSAGYAQCGAIEIAPITPAASSGFGNAIATDTVNGEHRLAVGSAAYDIAPYLGTGRVYIMGKISNAWGELTHIDKPSGIFNGDQFGYSVGYADPYLIVGCPGNLTNSGAAYIYERFGPSWTLKATVSHSEPAQRVGESVAMDGTYAIVGAPNTDFDGNPSAGNNNANSGSAHIFKRNGDGSWSQTFTIFNNDFVGTYINSSLGTSVALKGTIAVAGVPNGDLPAQPLSHGWIQVARRDALGVWANEGSNWIKPGNLRTGSRFGASVATDGTRIIVGAPDYPLNISTYGDEKDAGNAGAVYVMKLQSGDWVVEDQLMSPSPIESGTFGSSVAISGSRALVGAAGEKRAYAFRRLSSGQWVLDRAYGDEDAAGDFGSAVGIGDSYLYVGDTGDTNGALIDAGAVYVKAMPSAYSDSCEGAIVVEPGNTGGCTAEATLDGATTCGNGGLGGQGPDVWFAWTPRCSGNCIIDTFGSSYDTILSAHSACPEEGDTHTIQCNDDAGGVLGNTSLVTFNYTPDTTYLLRVSGYSRAMGNFVLRLGDFQNTPTNDACSSPKVVNPGTTAFKTCAATTDGPTDDGPFLNDEDTGADLWFSYVSPINRRVALDTCGSSFDTVLQVFAQSSCPVSNTQAINANDDTTGCVGGIAGRGSRVYFMAQPGQPYLIRVGGFTSQLLGSDTGDGVLNLTAVCPCDANADGLSTIDDLFTYINQYFTNDPAADMNNSVNITIDDLFLFFNCYFGGCS